MVYLVGERGGDAETTSTTTLVLWDGHRAEVHDLARGHTVVCDGILGRRLEQWLAHAADKHSDSASPPPPPPGEEMMRALVRLHADTPQAATLAELLAANQRVERAEPRRLLARQRLSVCFVELTAQCNERCTHCYAGSSPEVTTALPRAQLEEVVRDAHAAGFERIQFTGGDPLISPHLVPLAQLAHQLGFAQIEVYTNALALHAALLTELLACGCDFAVSLYSHDAATHDAITQTRQSHARTIANIKRAVKAGATVRVSVILMERNRGQLAETVEFVRDELGVPAERIGVDVVHEVGRGRKVPGLDEEARGVGITAAQQIHTGLPAKSMSQEQPGNEEPAAQQNERRLADWWAGKVAVAPDGAVYPCIFTRFVSLGNVLERPLRKILAEPQVELDPATAAQLASLDAHDLWRYLGERLRCIDCRLGTAAMIMGGREWVVGSG